MSAKMHWNRNSSAALSAILVVGLVNLYVAYVSLAPAGGQDSWNHYLYARWAPQHPFLLLDQWGKPFFTLLALPFAQFGIKGVLLLNHLCVLATAWLAYLTARKIGMRNPWMAIFLFAWQPIVLANVHSALTEPSNALVLVLVCYLYAGSRWVSATVLASFLPLVRSEGFVLLMAVMLFLVFRDRKKYLPYTLVGVTLYGLLGALVSGQWNWLMANNPYVRQELDGGFDAGSGNFWHYAMHQREITGVLVLLFCLISLVLVLNYVLKRLKRKTPANNSQMALWLWWPLFGLFFLAHSVLWWKGAMGSHGLLRVFMVVSPVAALLAMYGLDILMRHEIRILNRILKFLVSVGMFLLAFPGAGIGYPWNPTFLGGGVYNGESVSENGAVELAGETGSAEAGAKANPVAQAIYWVKQNGLGDRIWAHQIPAIDVFENYDPWAAEAQLHPKSPSGEWMPALPVPSWPKQAKTLKLWSLDAKDSGVNDWFPKGTVVIWDNFHGRRDGRLDKAQLMRLKKYRQVYGAGLTDGDTLNDVLVFVKERE
jgi:hypothetical protein